jgi:hypothetical protein
LTKGKEKQKTRKKQNSSKEAKESKAGAKANRKVNILTLADPSKPGQDKHFARHFGSISLPKKRKISRPIDCSWIKFKIRRIEVVRGQFSNPERTNKRKKGKNSQARIGNYIQQQQQQQQQQQHLEAATITCSKSKTTTTTTRKVKKSINIWI